MASKVPAWRCTDCELAQSMGRSVASAGGLQMLRYGLSEDAHVGEPVADEGLLAAVAAGGAFVEHHVAGLHLHVVLDAVVVQHVHRPRLLDLRGQGMHALTHNNAAANFELGHKKSSACSLRPDNHIHTRHVVAAFATPLCRSSCEQGRTSM